MNTQNGIGEGSGAMPCSPLAAAVSRLRMVDSYGFDWCNLLRDPDTDQMMLRDVQAVVRAFIGSHIVPVPCRINRPLNTRVLGWCADEKVWKCGKFTDVRGVSKFEHEGLGPFYGEHEVSHWCELPSSPV